MKFSETLSDFTMNYLSNEYHAAMLIAFGAGKVRRVGNVRDWSTTAVGRIGGTKSSLIDPRCDRRSLIAMLITRLLCQHCRVFL